MRFIKLSATIFAIALFLTACNTSRPDESTYTSPYPNGISQMELPSGENPYWARENLDLQAVGGLLERAKNAEEFEYLLNSENGVNNLDLNGDGYVDYISVEEFGDQYDDERGLSLFSRFGPNEILEIASLFFDRDRMDYPGARILMRGNEQLYGDNFYYETNWLDRSLAISNWLFSDRDTYYRSPYYYENYPDYYEVYPVVATPVYRTRVVQYYPEQTFIQTAQPTITQIKIKSPYEGRTVSKIKLPKLNKEQIELKKNTSNPPAVVPIKKENMKDVSFKPNDKSNPNNVDKPAKVNKERPNGWEKPNKIERIDVKPPKIQQQNQNQPKPEKMERQSMKPPKPNNNPKQGGPGNNPGKGNNGGGGKGGGKKP
jgi:hypothetical protein